MRFCKKSRFTDLEDEPVDRLLPPIRGYQDQPLVSLTEAIQPVSNYFDEIKNNVMIALRNSQNPADGLTQEESSSIHLYTMQFDEGPSLYELLNQSLRAENRQNLKPWFPYLRLFCTALNKLPSQSKRVWCGVHGVDLSVKYQKGTIFAWWGVTSCMNDMKALESSQLLGTQGQRTFFSIECINGKSVSEHSFFKTSEETILMPGSYFEVIDQLHSITELHIIGLKEVTTSMTLFTPAFTIWNEQKSSSVVDKPSASSSPTAVMVTPTTSTCNVLEKMTKGMIDFIVLLASLLTLTKDYMAQWAADYVYADEALIVPFPSLAIFDPDTNIWRIQITAWLYLPFESKKIKSYLSSLPTILSGKTEGNVEDSINQSNKKPYGLKSLKALVLNEANKYKSSEEKSVTDNYVDDDVNEDARQDFDKPKGKPDRLSLFFVGTPVKAAIKCIINDVEHLTKTSDENGLVEEQLELPHEEIQTISKIIHPESDDRQLDCEIRISESKTDVKQENFKAQKCTIYVLASHGVSIISDIDDTIKISKVLFIPSLLKNTFYDDFKPVNGMNELYQKWHKQKCQFHYVSASPWQL
ncbi:unnamed protein product [Rotaria sp. Silwood2]|nr:unnamed protein product [Rotaria sp. Silwood2]CAF4164808.1 unnamed protein product [Rotaria sp. Silwood2]